jgi:hypothetical protein
VTGRAQPVVYDPSAAVNGAAGKAEDQLVLNPLVDHHLISPRFGAFGGRYVPETLVEALEELERVNDLIFISQLCAERCAHYFFFFFFGTLCGRRHSWPQRTTLSSGPSSNPTMHSWVGQVISTLPSA